MDSKWKNVLIAALTVILICSLGTTAFCLYMFYKMSKTQESIDNMPYGQQSEDRPSVQSEDMRPNRPADEDNSPTMDTEDSRPSEPPEDMYPYGQDGAGRPAEGNAGNNMPSGQPEPGGFEGGRERNESFDWLGDDNETIEENLYSICVKGELPENADVITDVSKLTGLWKAFDYNEAADDDGSSYKCEVTVNGDEVKIILSNPMGDGTDSSDSNYHIGEYSGTCKTSDGMLNVTLEYVSEDGTADISKKISLTNIYTSDKSQYAAGILHDDSIADNPDGYIILRRPVQSK